MGQFIFLEHQELVTVTIVAILVYAVTIGNPLGLFTDGLRLFRWLMSKSKRKK